MPAWPVQAQTNPKPHRIAVVDPVNPIGDLTEAGGLPDYRGFFEELRRSGYIEGHNLHVDRFSGDGIPEHFPDLATIVVGYDPDLIFVPSTRLLISFKQLTTTIPIVGSDPIGYCA
jgi:putative ABC transport system substrate-binding protein